MQFETVNVVARAYRFDAQEHRVFDSPGKNQMASQFIAPEAHDRKTHPDLKCNAGLLWQYRNTAAAPHHFHKVPIKSNHMRIAAAKMFLERMAAAKMGLVAVCKPPAAARAFPHRLHEATSELFFSVIRG